MKNCTDMKLGEPLRKFIFLHFPYSGLYLLTCVTDLWKERERGFRALEKRENRGGGVGNAGKDANIFLFFQIHQ